MEIERKWVLKNIPKEMIKCAHMNLIEQGYLSLTPEIRIRCAYKLFADPLYVMTIKSEAKENGLMRDENEIDLTVNQYLELKRIIGLPMILKQYYRYNINDSNLILEVNIVDSGTENEFYYAEVEFENITDATVFNLPQWFIDECEPVEVTNIKKYKMKEYWNITRISDNKYNK